MNRAYIIMTEVTADLPADYYSKNSVVAMPITYQMDDNDYDGTLENSLKPEEFYAQLRNNAVAKTAQISPAVAHKYFKAVLDSGFDILYLGFSSGLTGGYQSVKIARDELIEEYPDAKIEMIDTLCASLGQGLFVDYAVKWKNMGKNLEQLKPLLEGLRPHICHYFTVDDLQTLYRGGRVSKTAAIFGTLLSIKPVMHVNDEGKLIPIAKVRGRRQSLDSLVSKMGEKLDSEFHNEYAFISHGDALADAQYVAKKVKERYSIKTQIINQIGPVIGSHSGPGTIALFFVGKDRSEKPM